MLTISGMTERANDVRLDENCAAIGCQVKYRLGEVVQDSTVDRMLKKACADNNMIKAAGGQLFDCLRHENNTCIYVLDS